MGASYLSLRRGGGGVRGVCGTWLVIHCWALEEVVEGMLFTHFGYICKRGRARKRENGKGEKKTRDNKLISFT